MKVDSTTFDGGKLTLKCSGAFGYGSDGTPSGNKIKSAVRVWTDANPAEMLAQIVVDFSEVDYEWGDGPVTGLLPFFKDGLKFAYIPSAKNREALDNLFQALNWRGFFSLEKPNESPPSSPGTQGRG